MQIISYKSASIILVSDVDSCRLEKRILQIFAEFEVYRIIYETA